MDNEFLHNVFGEKVGEKPEFADPNFGKVLQNGRIVPDYQIGDYTDCDGFDTRNIEENGKYTIPFMLAKGNRICRYGSEAGKYTTYVGSPYEQLALPWDINTVQYHEYEVIADGLKVSLVVTKGIVGPQPKFHSRGGAIQFLHNYTIEQEVKERYTLRRIDYDDEIGRKNHNDFKGNDDRHN